VTKTVFLHYTQDELNRNFDQRGWATNALEVIARCERLSKQTRQSLELCANVVYGAHPDEKLDIFPAAKRNGPTQIFVHGGAWKNFTKDDFSFPALAYVPAGINTVVLNFSKLPKERLPTVVDQVCRGIEWVHANINNLGGDPSKIYLSAQSSGAHLSATALQKGGYDFIRAATLVSGPYFLEPVMLSARSEYVELDEWEVMEYSPGLHPQKINCPVLLAYADNDTDEFQRQTKEFATGLAKAGRLQKLLLCPDVNHFELMECFHDPRHVLVRSIFEQMRIVRKA
jgi:arylformamidase